MVQNEDQSDELQSHGKSTKSRLGRVSTPKETISEHVSPSLSTVTPHKTNRTLQTTFTSSKSGLAESPNIMLDGNDSVDQEEPELSQTPLKAGVDKHFILNLFKSTFIY